MTLGIAAIILGFIVFVMFAAVIALLFSKTGRVVLTLGAGVMLALLLIAGLFVSVARVATRVEAPPQLTLEQVEPEDMTAKNAVARPTTVPMPEGLQPLVEVTPEDITTGGPATQQPIPEVPRQETPLSVRETVYRPGGTDQLSQPPVKSPNQLPDWVTSGGNAIHSDRFATVTEAQRQLQYKVQADLREIYKVQFPELSEWEPTMPQLLSSGFIRRECVAAYPLQVGEFTETVYEVTWDCQLRDNNAAIQQLEQMWRSQVSQLRVYYVAFGVLSVTVLLLASGLVLQRGRWEQSSQSA